MHFCRVCESQNYIMAVFITSRYRLLVVKTLGLDSIWAMGRDRLTSRVRALALLASPSERLPDSRPVSWKRAARCDRPSLKSYRIYHSAWTLYTQDTCATRELLWKIRGTIFIILLNSRWVFNCFHVLYVRTYDEARKHFQSLKERKKKTERERGGEEKVQNGEY